ncbi:hypothetical protein B0T16DRAFT_384360 [Cercophora newfieldiana]|uniref:Uncharacterized protein n=1 Tax=Cercophora newfieldiana TaxID=92897 RepID=A0AA39YMX8_9PEZI|nr:hypothetical protein B0T16DRAFT_384360 [Cercophora newfieldiana]
MQAPPPLPTLSMRPSRGTLPRLPSAIGSQNATHGPQTPPRKTDSRVPWRLSASTAPTQQSIRAAAAYQLDAWGWPMTLLRIAQRAREEVRHTISVSLLQRISVQAVAEAVMTKKLNEELERQEREDIEEELAKRRRAALRGKVALAQLEMPVAYD